MHHAARLSVIVLASLFFVNAANAINYGDFVGSTVVFEQVTDQNGLYGMPTVSADSLDFNPNAFEAGCPTPDCAAPLVDDTLTFTIQSDTGFVIDNIELSEAGDTTLGTFFAGDSAFTSVTASVFIDILEIDGVPVNNINADDQMVFTNGGTWNKAFDGVADTDAHNWNGFLFINLDQIIADEGETGQATRVTLNINNTLVATRQGGGIAFIEKKDFDGLAVTVVPEPGTAILMGLGLAGLASVRRTRLS